MTKKLLLGAASAIVMTSAAMAADLGARPALVAVPVFTWEGFFIGGNMGYAGNSDRLRYSNEFSGGALRSCRVTGDCNRDNSVIGGGQIGYNFQIGSIVYGIVADAAAMRLRNSDNVVFGNNTSPGAPFGSVANDTAYFRATQQGLYTVRGRLGYTFNNLLIFNNLLVYATGGLAISDLRINTAEILANGLNCPNSYSCRAGSSSKTLTGYTFGAGVEWALDERWSVGAEYLYVNLGTKKNVIPETNPRYRFPTSTTSAKVENQIARVTLNYRFNWW